MTPITRRNAVMTARTMVDPMYASELDSEAVVDDTVVSIVVSIYNM